MMTTEDAQLENFIARIAVLEATLIARTKGKKMIVHIKYNEVRQATDVFRNTYKPAQFMRIFNYERCGETEDMLIQLENLQKIKDGDSDMANWIFTDLVARYGLSDPPPTYSENDE